MQKIFSILKRSDYPYLIPIIWFIINVLFQSYGINKIVYPQTDEGIYLYEAKLITQGYIPYRDFNLAGHTPFLQLLIAPILHLLSFNIPAFDYVYIFWVFITIFPLSATVYAFTKNKAATIFSLLIFSTFVEFAQWDAHFFEIRQASLPFFAFFIYYFFVKKKYVRSQIFLLLFSISLVSNLIISVIFYFGIMCYEYYWKKYAHKRQLLKNNLYFFIPTTIFYITILSIPHSISNFASSQVIFVPFLARIFWIVQITPMNWPILLFGMWGLMILINQNGYFSFLIIITCLVSIFGSRSFSPHYLSIISIPFSIASGVFFAKYWRGFTIKNLLMVFILLYWIFLTTIPTLIYYGVVNRTATFFTIVQKLKALPDPLFTFEPIYAIYANKNIPYYYDSANMRIIRVTGKNLSIAEYEKILSSSNTILFEPFLNAWLPTQIKQKILKTYRLVYTDYPYAIYTR